jgi:hypothetical protein
MAQIRPWLRPFVESELSAIIDWKRNIQDTGAFRSAKQYDGRINDDGSNFSSRTSTDQDDFYVQIADVLTTNPTSVTLTDGVSSLRAVLSDEAVHVIESELDEELSKGTVGDVINLSDFTLFSTDLGPSDGFVHLAVRTVSYRYHLRKIAKSTCRIEDYEEIRNSITKGFRALRRRQFSLEQGTQHDPLDLSEDDGVSGANTDPATVNRSWRRSQSQDQTIATQVIPRKRAGPSLTKDGYEFENGVNLQGPQAANFSTSSKSRDKITSLLDLLGQGPIAPPLAQIPKSPQADISLKPGAPLRASSGPEMTKSPPSRTRRAQDVAQDSQHDLEGHSRSPENDLNTPKASQTPSSSRLLHNSAVPPQQPSLQQDSATSKENGVNLAAKLPTVPRVRHHEIPRDQRRLLEAPSAWLPSLPGQQFPQPNVPVDILRKWNERAQRQSQIQSSNSKAADAEELDVFGAQNDGDSYSAEQDASKGEHDDNETDTSSEEEIPWSSSPPAVRDLLPPDSTMNSTRRKLSDAGVNAQLGPESESSSAGLASQHIQGSKTPSTPHKYQTEPDSSQPRSVIGKSESGSQIVRRRTQNGNPVTDWTEEEDRILIHRLSQGRTMMEIAVHDLQHRTPSAIRNRKAILLRTHGEDIFEHAQPPRGYRSSRRSPVVEIPLRCSAPSGTHRGAQQRIPNKRRAHHEGPPSSHLTTFQLSSPANRASECPHSSSGMLDGASDDEIVVQQVQSDLAIKSSNMQAPRDAPESASSSLVTDPTQSVPSIEPPPPIAIQQPRETQDPSYEHRLRRREHFAQVKRIRW